MACDLSLSNFRQCRFDVEPFESFGNRVVVLGVECSREEREEQVLRFRAWGSGRHLLDRIDVVQLRNFASEGPIEEATRFLPNGGLCATFRLHATHTAEGSSVSNWDGKGCETILLTHADQRRAEQVVGKWAADASPWRPTSQRLLPSQLQICLYHCFPSSMQNTRGPTGSLESATSRVALQKIKD